MTDYIREVTLTPMQELEYIKNITKEGAHYITDKNGAGQERMIEIYNLQRTGKKDREYVIIGKDAGAIN